MARSLVTQYYLIYWLYMLYGQNDINYDKYEQLKASSKYYNKKKRRWQ